MHTNYTARGNYPANCNEQLPRPCRYPMHKTRLSPSTYHNTAHSSVGHLSDARHQPLRRLLFPSYIRKDSVEAYESGDFVHNTNAS